MFDTTASNSGKFQGAVALLEKHLKRAFLWLPCRHHVSELHIKAATVAVTGQPKSPGMKLFQRLRDDFSSIEVAELKRWSWPEDRTDHRYQKATKVSTWIQKCLSETTFPREDYRELAELIAFCLGCQVDRGLFIRQPGPDNHTRFMSKAIYYLKIFLLSESFPLYGKEVEEVGRMVEFILLYYGYYWLRSPLAASAPFNDLQYYHWMVKYMEKDKTVADANIASIKRHLDYLTEELVVFSLFDPDLPSEEKSMTAIKLFETPRPSSFPPGKPKLPGVIWPNDEDIPSLASFIGPRYYLKKTIQLIK